jgi:hypothetical protein
MALPKPPGPPPAAKRRRDDKPASYGLAESVVAGNAGNRPELGFDAHQMVVDMWESLANSVEGQFFSEGDWQRARWELFYANELFMGRRQMTPVAWSAVQHGLNELLLSPADKRRAGIELKKLAVDEDEVAAVDQIAEYKAKLAG